ncbi:hypothetical protein AC1031_007940 [Aphanomyces cochlioides]|nr:hypothetical protein AC1031_007940 [Aphanomyces cochlioides]
MEGLQGWLSQADNSFCELKVDLKRSSHGSLHLLLAIKDATSGVVHGYWCELFLKAIGRVQSASEMIEDLSKELGLNAEDSEPVHHSSKYFEVSEEDCTTIKALTRGQYKLVLLTQKAKPTPKILLGVFINWKHEYRLEKNESQIESTVTMEIPLRSNLCLYVSYLGTSACLNWLLKKL